MVMGEMPELVLLPMQLLLMYLLLLPLLLALLLLPVLLLVFLQLLLFLLLLYFRLEQTIALSVRVVDIKETLGGMRWSVVSCRGRGRV